MEELAHECLDLASKYIHLEIDGYSAFRISFSCLKKDRGRYDCTTDYTQLLNATWSTLGESGEREWDEVAMITNKMIAIVDPTWNVDTKKSWVKREVQFHLNYLRELRPQEQSRRRNPARRNRYTRSSIGVIAADQGIFINHVPMFRIVDLSG